MKRQRILYILIFFFCVRLGLCAQTVTICGKVLHKNSVPIDFYLIDAFDITNDTVFITQKIFTDSLFQMEMTQTTKYLLRFSEYGYNTVEKEIVYDSKERIDIGNIILDVPHHLLNEVVIVANKPVMRIESGRLMVKVENSSLRDMGDANNVLSRIPGIRKINNEYDIFGKGTPAIYVDGKFVQSKEELLLLKSTDISEIIVDKNPSAIYNADIRAVILIKTIKRLRDQFGLQIDNNSSFYRKYSNSSAVSIDWKKGITSANFGYRYAFGQGIIRESSYRYIYRDNNDIFYSNLDYKTKSNSRGHVVTGKIKLDFNDKSSGGLQYTGSFLPSDNELHDKTQQIESGNINYNRLINHKEQTHLNLHNISANYIYRFNETNTLTWIADYISKEETKNNFILEQNLASDTHYNTHLFSNNQYNIYTATFKYQFVLGNAFESMAGIRYAHIENYTQNRFLKSLENNDSETNLTDQITAGFFQTQKDWEKWSIQAGLRYEYDVMHIADQLIHTKTKRIFFNFVPNVRLEHQPNDVISLAVNYSQKIARPSFFELNTAIFYEDSLSYISGNKNLVPAYINHWSLNISYKDLLSFDCGYTQYKNKIFQTYITDPNLPDRVWMIPVNLNKTESWDLSLNYFLTCKKWTMSCMAMTVIPRTEAPYLNGFIQIDKPIWTFSVDNEFTFCGNWSLYQNFSYNSAGYDDLTYLHPTNNLTLGLIGKLLNNKLTLKIEGIDLLDGSNWNNWDVSYLNIKSGCRGNYDSRGIKISLSYKFNAIKSNIAIQKGNSDILNRIN